MSKSSEILIEYEGQVCEALKDAMPITRRRRALQEANAQFYALALEVIGEDELPVKADDFSYRSLERFRNQLRAEQRKRLAEVFGMGEV